MTDSHVNEPLLREIIKIQASQAIKISDFENKIGGIEKGVDRILTYIENDNATGSKGIVHKQKDMSNRLSQIENDLENTKIRNKTLIGAATFLGAVVTTIVGLLAKFTIFK